jgi:hypothetical protein
MPLRDHFHPPLSERTPWDMVHGGWPMAIATALAARLPAGYFAGPLVHLGSSVEIDVAAFETTVPELADGAASAGGVATAPWAPASPTRTVDVVVPDPDEYEVHVYDASAGRRLVAAVELVSPSNKDRPEHRRAFADKCAALLRRQVSVVIVDIVTARTANLCRELFDFLGRPEPSPAAEALLYTVACRYQGGGRRRQLKTWEQPLAVGQPLPTLPLWLADDLAVPLELEATYEETCRVLRIP